MDLSANNPQTQHSGVIENSQLAAFGLSLQGASHRLHDPPVPCQDSHGIRWLPEEGILVAAIADGVGSCKLSHWGAYTAVNTALDCAEDALRKLANRNVLRLSAEDTHFRSDMKEIMLAAFRKARNAVETLADSAQPPQLVFQLQSTLTLAIYDGCCLYYGHVGDDGLVAQLPDGTVEMATSRLKGEEASSVFPLQSGEEYWQFGLVPKVVGFVMATDGVLDAFVQSHPDYFGINYFNGICYAFMEDAMTILAERNPGAAGKALQKYMMLLQSDEYTARVTDDLTLVAVVSREGMTSADLPRFNTEIWNTIARESALAKRRALNHSRQKPAAVSPNAMPWAEDRTEQYEETDESLQSASMRRRQISLHTSGILVAVCLALAMLAGLLLGKYLPALMSAVKHVPMQQADLASEESAIENDSGTADTGAPEQESEEPESDTSPSPQNEEPSVAEVSQTATIEEEKQ